MENLKAAMSTANARRGGAFALSGVVLDRQTEYRPLPFAMMRAKNERDFKKKQKACLKNLMLTEQAVKDAMKGYREWLVSLESCERQLRAEEKKIEQKRKEIEAVSKEIDKLNKAIEQHNETLSRNDRARRPLIVKPSDLSLFALQVQLAASRIEIEEDKKSCKVQLEGNGWLRAVPKEVNSLKKGVEDYPFRKKN